MTAAAPDTSPDIALAHPRHTHVLFGHGEAEARLAGALARGTLHHGLLLTGPRGIGKATLAYRIARRLLAGQGAARDAGTLAVDPEADAARQVAAGSHPDLVALHDEGEGARASGAILVEDVRRLNHFYNTTASAGGWRVGIVDAAESMNQAAANALLKTLEEPPDQALIVLVSHNPGRVSATIRSRCLRLSLAPLETGDLDSIARHMLGVPMAEGADLHLVGRLGEGSFGHSLRLARGGGLALYRELRDLVADLPRLDHAAAHSFADRLAAPRAREEFALAVELLLVWLAGSIRLSAGEGGEPADEAAFSRLPGRLARWAEVWEKIARTAALADTYNLDRKHVLFQAFTDLAEAARS